MMVMSLTFMIAIGCLSVAAGWTCAHMGQHAVAKLRNLQSSTRSAVASTIAALTILHDPSISIAIDINAPSISRLEEMRSELENYQEDLESLTLRQKREPKNLMEKLKTDLDYTQRFQPPVLDKATLENARERVLTLAAYLDEIQRDLFSKNWENLQVYLYTFAEQEDAFAALIDGLFPAADRLDSTARESLSFEARSMFVALDDLREASRLQKFKSAQRAYSNLLLSYDRFLKAGDLYPTYDPFTSTEIFFKGTPKDTLKFDTDSKVQVLDTVVLTGGPDMGKTGTVIFIDGTNAIVKLDKDGKAYQEVKDVKLTLVAKTDRDKPKRTPPPNKADKNSNAPATQS